MTPRLLGSGTAPLNGVRRTQRERTERTKNKLLRAAITVLTTKGYGNFTTAEVAKVAGTSRGSLTYHFESTQVFILAALDNLYAVLLRQTERRVEEAKTNEDMIAPIIADASDFLFGTAFLSIYNTLIEMRNSGSGDHVNEIGIRYRQPIEELWTEHLVSRGVSKDEAANVVWTIFSIVRGLAVRKVLTESAPTKEVMEFATELLSDRIRANLAKSGAKDLSETSIGKGPAPGD